MIKKILIFILLLFSFVYSLLAQNEAVHGLPDEAYHTANRYNFFLLNPAFSYDKKVADSGDKNGYISLFGRLEKTNFENSPTNYRVSYNKILNEYMAVGGSLFQHTVGIISHFGALGNYTYNVEYSRDVDVAFGANIKYQRSALSSGVISQSSITSDELLSTFDGVSLLRVSPGISLHYKDFNFGFTAHNILNVFLSTESAVYDTSTLAIQAIYDKPFSRRSPNSFRGLLYVEKETDKSFAIGLSSMLTNTKYGFVQLGYNTEYGPSLGLGYNLKPSITLGYTIENTLSQANFGLTHEFTLAYNFVEPVRRSRSQTPKKSRKLPERKELSKAEKLIALEEARKANEEKLANIGKIKDTTVVANQNQELASFKSDLVEKFNNEVEQRRLEDAKSTLTLINKSTLISDEEKNKATSTLTRLVNEQKEQKELETQLAIQEQEEQEARALLKRLTSCLLYTSPSPRDA